LYENCVAAMVPFIVKRLINRLQDLACFPSYQLKYKSIKIGFYNSRVCPQNRIEILTSNNH
jgi:hypothetical protein